MKEKLACKSCMALSDEERCPSCGSEELTSKWKGLVIVKDPDCEIAKLIDAKKSGKYAIKVR